MKFFAQTTYRSIAVSALAGLVFVTGCEKKTATDVLARVGDQTITTNDFKAELQRRIANRQNIPDRQKLLDEMVSRALLVQRAKAAGLENASDVRRTFEDVLIAKLKEAELEPKVASVKVSPEEVRAAYDQGIAHFTQPGKTHLAIIHLAANSKSDTNRLAEIAARANEAHKLALDLPASVPGFGTVAADFSEDQITRYRGGDDGWFTDDQLIDRWPKEVLAAGLALQNNGEVSDIIHATDGFYFVKRMDNRPSVVTPFAQAQAGIERRLLATKRARTEDEFRQTLLAKAKVQTDSQLLSQMDYPTQSVASAAKSIPPSLPRSP